jgi:putative membrane protein
MNRRLLLASIATLATTRVLAQTNAPVPNGAPQAAPSVAPQPAPGLTSAQQKHINDTMAVGSLSLMLSRIAQAKANHLRLKQFVEFEIAEQETVADVLKALETNVAPTGSIKAPTDAEVMQNLDAEGKAAVEKLRNLRAGAEFDREYIRYEVEGHRKLLDTQEAYLKSPDNLDETNVAKLARGMIKEHLTLLADMENVG